MHIWTIENWKNVIPNADKMKSGVYFRFDRSVCDDFKRACKRFSAWLRCEYSFPIKVNVYIKGTDTIKAKDGERVAGLFFEPASYGDYPYIKIAAGDYNELVGKYGYDNACATVFETITHELTHYFQWINRLELTDTGAERQASRYAEYVLYEYSSTRDHP